MKLGELQETVKRLLEASEESRNSLQEELRELQSKRKAQGYSSEEEHLKRQLSLHNYVLDTLGQLASRLDGAIQSHGYQAEAPKELVDVYEEARRILERGATTVTTGVARNQSG